MGNSPNNWWDRLGWEPENNEAKIVGYACECEIGGLCENPEAKKCKHEDGKTCGACEGCKEFYVEGVGYSDGNPYAIHDRDVFDRPVTEDLRVAHEEARARANDNFKGCTEPCVANKTDVKCICYSVMNDGSLLKAETPKDLLP